MKPLEDELKTALSRVEPPAGFTGRVMARVAAQSPAKKRLRSRVVSFFRFPRLRWAALAAIVAIVLAGAEIVHRREQRLKAEAAKREVLFALRLAGSKLNLAMRRADDIERRRSLAAGTGKSQ